MFHHVHTCMHIRFACVTMCKITVSVRFFFLLKAKVCNGGESTEESSMEATTIQPQTTPSSTATTNPSSSTKKIGRTRKNERRKKTEDDKILSPSHTAGPPQNQSQGLDMGYLSGGSQCTPGMVAIGTTGNPPVGHTPLSGYNSSGYDTEYPSLPEDHGIPALVNGDPLMENGGKISIKTEHFSPQSQSGNDHLPFGLPPPYKPCYVPNRPNKYQPVSTLQTLPEIIGPTGGGTTMMGDRSSSTSGFLRNNRTINPQETFSSGYSSFDGSPIRTNDDVSSISGSSSSHHQNFRNSDLSSSSHSSYSTLSSRLSSPTSGFRRNNFDSGMKLPEYNTALKPFHHHQPMAGDFKLQSPYFSRQHSEDMGSIRSSHSSKFSSSVSEFSDDFHTGRTAIHDIEFSSRQPLPPIVGSNSQSQSMPPFEQSQYLPSASSVSNLQSPESCYTDSSMSGGGGSIPLQHLGMMSPLQKAPPLPMVMDASLVRSESPNLMVGNMSSFSNQLQQENLLFESLASNSGPPPNLIHLSNIN